MKVLVIGSRGYIGARLYQGLVREGIDVHGASSADGSGIDPVSGLLPNNFALPATTDVVVYVAQSPYFRRVPDHSPHLMAVNCLSAISAANAARKAGVSRFIYVSTGTVYAPSFSPLAEGDRTHRDDWYALSKLQAEEALGLFRSDMQICCVRPFGVYGPAQSGRLIQNLAKSVQDGKPITLQSAASEVSVSEGLKISLCYIDDAIEVFIALVKGGGPYLLNLAGKDAISIRAIADAIGRLKGLEPTYSMTGPDRSGDLVANIDLLIQTVPIRFTSFSDGLAASLPLLASSTKGRI